MTLLDDFATGSGALDDRTNWSRIQGSYGDATVNGGEVEPSASGDWAYIYTGSGGNPGADQRCTVLVNDGGTAYAGPLVRGSAGANHYSVQCDCSPSSAGYYYFNKWVSGSYSDLGNGTLALTPAGTRLRMEAEGTTVRFLVDRDTGTFVEEDSSTDASLSSGNVGAAGYGSNSNGLLDIDGEAIGGGSVTGTGNLNWPAFAVDGTGTVEVTGTGELVWPAFAADGTGTVEVTGTGELAWPAFTIDGSGESGIFGTGNLEWPAFSADGTGTVEVTGTGELIWPVFVADGTGTVEISGTGELVWLAFTIDGSGESGIFGSGNLEWSSFSIDATGTVEVTGTGNLDWPTWDAEGSGTVVITGTGNLEWDLWTIDGAGGLSEITGTGNLEWPSWGVDGSGTVAVSGSGNLSWPAFVIEGNNATLPPYIVVYIWKRIS